MKQRVILDLCAGSRSWSKPYKDSGYYVISIDYPDDVRIFITPDYRIHGILAAPPCTEFSVCKNYRNQKRDFVKGMECVNACMRIILQSDPLWWALENPVGMLSRWLHRPRLIFNPWEYGDPWTKRTALWGKFIIPKRTPVKAKGSFTHDENGSPRHNGALRSYQRSITPPGFANAFFKANP